MDTVSEETTSVCPHCNRSIPSLNFDLHSVHCARNLEKCKLCGDMVPRKLSEEHYQSKHAPKGNRTENCHHCGSHNTNERPCSCLANAVGSSFGDVRAIPERVPRQRRGPPPYPRSRLFFTVAITGIAFMVGSFFLQKKSDGSSELH